MKHRFLSKRYWKDSSTAMGASEGRARAFDDIINLSIGDTDLITDRIIIDGAYRDACAGHTKYTETRGDPELRSEIAAFYQKQYAMTIRDEEIMVTASGCIAMYLALEAILDDGDEVIVPTPCFTPYLQQIGLARGVPVELPTSEEEGFQINPTQLEAAITERTKALIINTPNNPTGAALTRQTLEQVAEIAKKHDLLIIADDIYTLFCYEEPFLPIASLPGMKDRTITINSFSKNYLMTGWRIGYIVAPDYIVRTIQQINENVAFTTCSVSQRAAIHALRNREAVQPAILAEYKKRAMLVVEKVAAIPRLSVLSPGGTFYLFLNIKATGLSSAEAADRILQEAHVLMLPGDAFGAAGEGYLRMACTSGCDRLTEAFDRIAAMPLFKRTDS